MKCRLMMSLSLSLRKKNKIRKWCWHQSLSWLNPSGACCSPVCSRRGRSFRWRDDPWCHCSAISTPACGGHFSYWHAAICTWVQRPKYPAFSAQLLETVSVQTLLRWHVTFDDQWELSQVDDAIMLETDFFLQLSDCSSSSDLRKPSQTGIWTRTNVFIYRTLLSYTILSVCISTDLNARILCIHCGMHKGNSKRMWCCFSGDTCGAKL